MSQIDYINSDFPHQMIPVSMGTDLDTVSKRLNKTRALWGSDANPLEVDRNMDVPVVTVEQAINWKPRTPHGLLGVSCDTFATGQTVLPETNWRAELQTANAGLDYIYRTAFPRLLCASAEGYNAYRIAFPLAAEEDNTESVKRKFPAISAEWNYTNININTIPHPQMRWLLRQSAVMVHWGDISLLHSLTRKTERPIVNTETEVDKNAIWTEILERFNEIAQREDNWDGLESKKPIKSSLIRAECLIEKLLDDLLSEGYSWHMFKPLISCGEDGYVTVRWRGNGKRLHLQIEEDEVRYIQSWKENNKRKARACRTSSDNCFEIWEWLINDA